MPVGIGASGVIGVAFEATPGVYVAPAKFFPIASEKIEYKQEVTHRRVIRGTPDSVGSVKGNGSVEGEISMEVLPDAIPYFLYASRTSIVKSGVGPWTYTVTGGNGAVATTARTLSITVVRNGIVFGYLGCIIGSSDYAIKDGVLMVTHKLVGLDEVVQTAPTATYTTIGPFGMGSYTVKFNTVTDANISDMSISIDDSASAEFRLSGTTGADLVRFGERTTKVSYTRDFLDRTEYDAFRAMTAQNVDFKVVNGGDSFQLLVPVTVVDTYEISLNNPGDLVRAKIDGIGDYNAAAGASWQAIVISTTANIT